MSWRHSFLFKLQECFMSLEVKLSLCKWLHDQIKNVFWNWLILIEMIDFISKINYLLKTHFFFFLMKQCSTKNKIFLMRNIACSNKICFSWKKTLLSKWVCSNTIHAFGNNWFLWKWLSSLAKWIIYWRQLFSGYNARMSQ